MGVAFEYERESFPWVEVSPNGYCPTCGDRSVVDRSYTPDFFLPNDVIIESKGRFTPKDRKIAIAMRDAGRDVRLLFQFDNRLSRSSKTRYSGWCIKNNIMKVDNNDNAPQTGNRYPRNPNGAADSSNRSGGSASGSSRFGYSESLPYNSGYASLAAATSALLYARGKA
jgi:hypothetical protein